MCHTYFYQINNVICLGFFQPFIGNDNFLSYSTQTSLVFDFL